MLSVIENLNMLFVYYYLCLWHTSCCCVHTTIADVVFIFWILINFAA